MKYFIKQHENNPTYSILDIYKMLYTFIETSDFEGVKLLANVILEEKKKYSLIHLKSMLNSMSYAITVINNPKHK